jgi:hypothetical protein
MSWMFRMEGRIDWQFWDERLKLEREMWRRSCCETSFCCLWILWTWQKTSVFLMWCLHIDEYTFMVYGEFITWKSVFGQRSVEIVCYSSGKFSSNNFTNVNISITAPCIWRKWGHTYIDTRILCYFYGYETWPVVLREKHKLRVLENKLLRKIFGGPKGWGGSRQRGKTS